MGLLFFRNLEHQLRVVSVSNLLDRTDIDNAVMKVVHDFGELAQHKNAVHVDCIASQHGRLGLGNVLLEVIQQVLLDLFPCV